MRKLLLFAAMAMLPWLACAQPAIDGMWKTDPKTVTGANKPSHYIVDARQYRCESCAPKIKVAADGVTRPIPGHPFIQSLSARIVDDRTFEVTSQAGKVVTVGKMTISADGRSMIREITTREANGTTSDSTEVLTRVGPLPGRGHVVSGKWRFSTLVRMSEETLTFKTAAGTLNMNASDGSGYDALLDGTRAPVRNSPGTDGVSVSKKAPDTWEETSYSGDKPIWVNTMVVARDGAKMKVTWEDKLRASRGSFVMVRQ